MERAQPLNPQLFVCLFTTLTPLHLPYSNVDFTVTHVSRRTASGSIWIKPCYQTRQWILHQIPSRTFRSTLATVIFSSFSTIVRTLFRPVDWETRLKNESIRKHLTLCCFVSFWTFTKEVKRSNCKCSLKSLQLVLILPFVRVCSIILDTWKNSSVSDRRPGNPSSLIKNQNRKPVNKETGVKMC